MTCILELNDADLTLYRNSAVLYRSPGVAVVLDKEVCFGEEALRLSRIHPRQANQQYFSRLNADPLAAPGGRARNHADLVYLHLKTFKPLIDAEGGDVLLAVPGILSADQLGVLLGILQEADIGVCGFVDCAVAAVSTRQAPAEAYYLDMMLQRAVVTALRVNTEISKTASLEVQECGLNRLLDGWINVIADRFVRETRFDPLHAAATEQQLYNQIYDWIDHGAEGSELTVEIVLGDHTRRVELARATLEQKAEQRFRKLADALPPGSQVFLSARSARLPGLQQALEGMHLHATALPADALARGCMQNLRHIVTDTNELKLVTRLPHGFAVEAPAPGPGAAAPTHALRGGQAWPLAADDPVLPLRREKQRFLLRPGPGVLLNGAPLEQSTPLNAGDRVDLGEGEYLIIHVRE